MPVVNIKGVGPMEFPDSMSPDEISTAIHRDVLPKFPELAAKTKRTWGEAATDIGGSLLSGVGQLAQLPGQISDLAGLTTPEKKPTGLQGLGSELEQYGQGLKSPTLVGKEAMRNQKIAQAEEQGMFTAFKTAIGETIKDPALLTSFFAEQIPNLAGSWGGGLLAKGATKAVMAAATEEALAKALPKAGLRGAVGTGAIQQGADIGHDTYKTIYDKLTEQGMSDHDANAIALSKGRIAAIEAAGISLGTAKLPGGASIERALAGKGLPGAGGFLKGALGEAASEAIEEGGGKFASNVGVKEVFPETSLSQGVGSAAGMGALGGALFGGPAGAVNARYEAKQQQAIDTQNALNIANQQAQAQAAQQEQAAQEPLALGMAKPFTPVGLPDGSVAMTQEDLDTYERTKGLEQYAPVRIPEVIGQDTFKEIGIGGGPNIKIKQQLLGKDLRDPVQVAEVKSILEDYANGKNRSANIIKGVETFLQRPEFKNIEQGEINAGISGINGEADRGGVSVLGQTGAEPTAEGITAPNGIPMGGVNAPTKKPKVRKANVQPTLTEQEQADIQAELDAELGQGTPANMMPVFEITAEEDFKTIQRLDRKRKAAELEVRRAQNSEENKKAKEKLQKIDDEWNTYNAKAEPIRHQRIEALTNPMQQMTQQLAPEEQQQEVVEQPPLRPMAEDLVSQEIPYTKAEDDYASLKDQIAFNEEGIQYATTPKERLELQRENVVLRQQLAQLQQPKPATKGKPKKSKQNKAIDLNDPDPKEAKEVEDGIKGKTPYDVAVWIEKNAPDSDYKYIAGRVAQRIRDMEKAGAQFELKVMSKTDMVPSKLLGSRGLSTYRFSDKEFGHSIYIQGSDVTGYVGTSYKTVLHELIHAVTQSAVELGKKQIASNTELQKDIVKLWDVTKAIKDHFNTRARANPEQLTDFEKAYLKRNTNALHNAEEVIAWALTDRGMQEYLESIPYKNSSVSMWSKLVQSVRDFLGLKPSNDTALSEVLQVSDRLLSADLGEMGNIASTIGYNLHQAGSTKADLDSLLNATGYKEKPAEVKGLGAAFQNIKAMDEAKAKSELKNYLSKFQTMYFSSDAGLSNRIQEELNKNGTDWETVKDLMYQVSTSQALHADAVANQFLEKGDLEYDPKTYKFYAKDSNNSWRNIIKKIDDISKQTGIPAEDINKYANQALIAERLNGLSKSNQEVYSHMSPEQIKAGLELFNKLPQLREVQSIWNGVRQNAMKIAVDSGLYSKKQAEELLNYMDYVPFYRADQIASKAGPREYNRGLLDFAKNFKIKGSEQEVVDIFDNMERWTSYTISRAVKNRTALNMYNVAKQTMPDEVRELRQDERVKREQNVVEMWVNGQRQRIEFDDPLFVHAFEGVQSVSIPMLTFWAKAANIFRKSIVLNPLFSASQLSQDSISAMFTSGLKQPFRIPLEVMSEFYKTLSGTSKAHAELAKYGVVGVRDYSSTMARTDAEIAAGYKQPTKLEKLLSPFEKFAMASDNAVRQAIYNRTLAEGGSKAEAVERAFEIINFKRAGASASAQALRQVVPFLGAYLQAQNVMYKTISGKGISPSEKAAAQKTLLATTAKVMALMFVYTAIASDDDDYQNMDPAIRDRHLMIPGTKFMLPLRSDLSLLPKLVAEYSYLSMTDNGFTDGKKVRRAMSDAVVNAISSPTLVPQAVKPLLETMVNYDFFSGRPIIGTGMENLPTAQQYSVNTSEFAKFLGGSGLISPMNVDHLIKGMLGTTGGFGIMLTNAVAHAGSNTPSPEKSLQDAIASIPGASAFVMRENGNAMKNDYYELRGEVDKTVNGYNRLVKQGRVEEAKEFYEERKDLFKVKTQVNNIDNQLTKIRAYQNYIYELPESKMNSEQKGAELKRLKEMENAMLKNVHMLRQTAGY
jgi:hypothetical protein